MLHVLTRPMRPVLIALAALVLVRAAAGEAAPTPMQITLPESRLATHLAVIALGPDGQPTAEGVAAVDALAVGGWRPSAIRVAGDRLLVQAVRTAGSKESNVAALRLAGVPLSSTGVPTADGEAVLTGLANDGFRCFGLALVRRGDVLTGYTLGMRSAKASSPPENRIEPIALGASGMDQAATDDIEQRAKADGWRINGVDLLDGSATTALILLSRNRPIVRPSATGAPAPQP
jgi:hypothetical protein